MTKDKYDVFISYSHEDAPWGQFLAEVLESNGINAWSDAAIQPGSEWKEEIEMALEHSKIFLLVITLQFLASPWKNFELGVALSRAATSSLLIIPLVVKRLSIQSLPKPLRDLKVISVEKISPGETAKKETAKKVVEAVENALSIA